MKHEAPGPGAWQLDATHFARPFTTQVRRMYRQVYERAFEDAFEAYGVALNKIAMGFTDGFVYTQPQALGAPPDAKGPPPKIVFKLLTWLHPAMRRRMQQADLAWASKKWREEAKSFYEDWLPKQLADNRAFQRIDPRELDDSAIVSHVRAAQRLFDDATYLHHRIFPAFGIPVGHFVAQVAAWTGVSRSAALALMRGCSEVSRESFPERKMLLDALAGHADAVAILSSDDPPQAILERLAQNDGVGEAMRGYLDVVSHVILTDFDVCGLTAHEAPEMLIKCLRETVAGTNRSQTNRVAEQTAELRAKVPEQHRPEFDAILEDARRAYPIRDDRCNLNDMWALGLWRRALLELGRRLVHAGKLRDAEHAFELTTDELERLWVKDDPELTTVAASRSKRRVTADINQMPEVFGTPSPPPPPEWFPSPAMMIHRAVGAYVEGMFGEPEAQTTDTSVKGLAASGGTYVGTARLVLEREDFNRVQPGDVLIARVTTPTYNVLLPLIGAVVTDRGGLLAHPAIVAREYGIPGVVGTKKATSLIPDGAQVEVDGDAGIVRVLA